MQPAGLVSVAIRVNGGLRTTNSDLVGDALFPIYSITKTLTAICLLRLAERGAVSTSMPARHWLPDVDIPASITLAHLLRHTSGLRDYGPLPEYHQAVRRHSERPWTRQQFLDAVLPPGLLFAPGEGWSYSNVGYMLVVEIIERVTGQPFAQSIREFLTTPLGLCRTVVLEEIDDLRRCVAGFGPELSEAGETLDVRGRYHPGWCAPRVMASTADEITLIFDGLLGGALLGPAMLEEMLTVVPIDRTDHPAIGSGMGVFADRSSPERRNYCHGGGGPGYDLSAAIYPETALGRVSIATFVNSSAGPRSNDLEESFLTTLLGER